MSDKIVNKVRNFKVIYSQEDLAKMRKYDERLKHYEDYFKSKNNHLSDDDIVIALINDPNRKEITDTIAKVKLEVIPVDFNYG